MALKYTRKEKLRNLKLSKICNTWYKDIKTTNSLEQVYWLPSMARKVNAGKEIIAIVQLSLVVVYWYNWTNGRLKLLVFDCSQQNKSSSLINWFCLRLEFFAKRRIQIKSSGLINYNFYLKPIGKRQITDVKVGSSSCKKIFLINSK